MAFSGNNQTVYNAAFAGSMAGMMAASKITDATAADYAALGAIATLFATQVDAQIATNANLSTGAGGTTIDPVAGVTTASLNAFSHTVGMLCFGYWFGSAPQTRTAQVTADFTVPAKAIAAAYAQATTQFGLAPGGSSLT